MTERERFIKALNREPLTGHVPTFELVFFLTMEAIGRPFHNIRYNTWNQMSSKERELYLKFIASNYVDIAEKYNHSAISVNYHSLESHDDFVRELELIRELSGDKYFLGTHLDPTHAIPSGDYMTQFSVNMYTKPRVLLDESRRETDKVLEAAYSLSRRTGLLDGFFMCSDYCFGTNSFFSPEMFAKFIKPFLRETISGYKELGFYAMKHTDGDIMPILDQIVDCGPHALHSLDPQAGVDVGEVKRLYGDRIALCGNVNCGLLQTGTDEEVRADVRRSLKQGMEGWGYIFCTSNCIYPGMPLERYEMMHRIWREEGKYPDTNTTV